MNIKLPSPTSPIGFCLIKNPNTTNQRFLQIGVNAGVLKALEVVDFDKATQFNKWEDAQQWLTALSQTNRYRQLSQQYSIRSFNRS